MNKMMTLIALIAMSTLTLQANTVDSMSEALTEVVQVVSSSTEATTEDKTLPKEAEANDSKTEEKISEEKN